MFTGKNDLSAETAKIDMQELLTMAKQSVMTSRVLVEREIGKLQNSCFANNMRDMANDSRNLAEWSATLARACESLHLLNESQTRDEIVFVNRKPKTN